MSPLHAAHLTCPPLIRPEGRRYKRILVRTILIAADAKPLDNTLCYRARSEITHTRTPVGLDCTFKRSSTSTFILTSIIRCRLQTALFEQTLDYISKSFRKNISQLRPPTSLRLHEVDKVCSRAPSCFTQLLSGLSPASSSQQVLCQPP
jgi:hypothetical protein